MSAVLRRKSSVDWAAFKEAVASMKLHDLLIWAMPAGSVDTASVRKLELHTTEFVTIGKWFDGKFFIVRVK